MAQTKVTKAHYLYREDQIVAIRKMAKKLDISQSELVRRFIDEGIKET